MLSIYITISEFIIYIIFLYLLLYVSEVVFYVLVICKGFLDVIQYSIWWIIIYIHIIIYIITFFYYYIELYSINNYFILSSGYISDLFYILYIQQFNYLLLWQLIVNLNFVLHLNYIDYIRELYSFIERQLKYSISFIFSEL